MDALCQSLDEFLHVVACNSGQWNTVSMIQRIGFYLESFENAETQNTLVNDLVADLKVLRSYWQQHCHMLVIEKATTNGTITVDYLPEQLLLKIFSNINWLDRIKLELVSHKWNRVLLDKSLRKIENLRLSSLVKYHWKLPQAVRSLIIEKHKIIEGFVIDIKITPSNLVYVLGNFTSFAAGNLKRISATLYYNDFSIRRSIGCCLNLCVNLEVLDLCDTHRYTLHPINLAGLLQLKELTGKKVWFRNCRAPALTKLDYRQVHMHYTTDNSNDLLLMIFTAAQSIEQLHLSDICLIGSNNKSLKITCTMPKLIRIKLCDTGLFGLTIDLAQSRNLEDVHIYNVFTYTCQITNFDISVHNLLSLNCSGYGETYNAICTDVITSIVAHPDRLCLLKKIVINLDNYERLGNLFNIISPFYVYVVNYLELSFCGYRWSLLPCGNGLTTLVKSSPELESVNLSYFSIDRQYLVDLIMARIKCNIGFKLFKFGRISGCSDYEFLTELYDALCSIDVTFLKFETICIHFVATKDNIFPELKMRYITNTIIKRLKNEFDIVIEVTRLY